MDCPFCGKEMKEGRIPANQQLKWYDNTVDTVMGEGVPLRGDSGPRRRITVPTAARSSCLCRRWKAYWK